MGSDPWTLRKPVRRVLRPEQQLLADQLHARAARIREESEEGLSIAEAVDLAAVQLGLQAPGGGPC